MADELELKAVIPDPDALREPASARRARRERFRARMSDRRFDRAGELVARGRGAAGAQLSLRRRPERVRSSAGRVRCGARPTGTSSAKRSSSDRAVGRPAGSPDALLAALGYDVVHAIDRDVEVYDAGRRRRAPRALSATWIRCSRWRARPPPSSAPSAPPASAATPSPPTRSPTSCAGSRPAPAGRGAGRVVTIGARLRAALGRARARPVARPAGRSVPPLPWRRFACHSTTSGSPW